MQKINGSMKAVFAGVTAFLGSLQVALVDGQIVSQEWVTIAAATVAALALVYGVSNDTEKVL